MLGPLFDRQPDFDRDALREKLASLAGERIRIGGSSWKYEGWLGQLYSRERYVSRGRFSKRRFEAECLREYAETFPIVCGDFAFYQFPTEEFWQRLFAQTPEGFQFAFKVPEQITCMVYPTHVRYGALAGRENESFLDERLLEDLFLRPLGKFSAKTALLIFEFGALARRTISGLDGFPGRLDPFLAKLPPEFRYSIEVRNPEFLDRPYFECLRSHRVAHVYTAWARMPELREQVSIPDSRTADFSVCRALLRRGRPYEKAVAEFAPYTEIRDPNPAAREAMRELIERAREDHNPLFLFVNNRLEGNAPFTIQSVVEGV